jgi:hypothetical protein
MIRDILESTSLKQIQVVAFDSGFVNAFHNYGGRSQLIEVLEHMENLTEVMVVGTQDWEVALYTYRRSVDAVGHKFVIRSRQATSNKACLDAQYALARSPVSYADPRIADVQVLRK